MKDDEYIDHDDWRKNSEESDTLVSNFTFIPYKLPLIWDSVACEIIVELY